MSGEVGSSQRSSGSSARDGSCMVSLSPCRGRKLSKGKNSLAVEVRGHSLPGVHSSGEVPSPERSKFDQPGGVSGAPVIVAVAGSSPTRCFVFWSGLDFFRVGALVLVRNFSPGLSAGGGKSALGGGSYRESTLVLYFL